MDKVILHSDLNNFYASVECLTRPELAGLPVAVGGDAEMRHGIILAKNEIAKKYGVKTGEAIWEAKQKCSNIVILTVNMKKYIHYSGLVKEIYARYTDNIEPFGLDECWLDVTGSRYLFGDGETIANEIRNAVKEELGLTVSVGVSFNKIFSKLGSDMKKPDAVTVITRENFKQKIWPLKASELLYVGRATTAKLKKLGVLTIGDIANCDEGILVHHLGKWGYTLLSFANGLDCSEVVKCDHEFDVKSIGNSMTLASDITDMNDAKNAICVLSESVGARLRQTPFKASGVSVTIKDTDFNCCEHQCKVSPTILSGDITNAATELLHKNYSFERPIRALGVRVFSFVPHHISVQMDFEGVARKKAELESLEHCSDKIRARFGYCSLMKASIMKYIYSNGTIPILDNTVHPVSYFR